jgi:hypothetical protein
MRQESPHPNGILQEEDIDIALGWFDDGFAPRAIDRSNAIK